MNERRSGGTSRQTQLRVKVWLEIDGQYVFGFGLSEILKAVDATGSIKQGARRLGKSYRHVWGRIKKAEAALGQPLVQTQVGGQGPRRSTLSALAHRWVRHYDALRERMVAMARKESADHFALRPAKL